MLILAEARRSRELLRAHRSRAGSRLLRSTAASLWLAGLAGCVFDASGIPVVRILDGRPADAFQPVADRSLDSDAAGSGDRLTAERPPPREGSVPPPDLRLGDKPAPDQMPPDSLRPDQPVCPAGQTPCTMGCFDLKIDPLNCGKCGQACGEGEVCQTGSCQPVVGCAAGIDTQVFQQGMRGCKGIVLFSARASLCASGFRVCTAAEWVARRGGQAPTYHYWTNDVLYTYNGQSSSNCAVTLNSAYYCNSTTPMRVCAGKNDPLGNTCNWINCGLNSITPNQYFGGCQGNYYAGALCCPK